MIPELKKASRDNYLKHREEQVIDLFKRNMEDEKRVFGDYSGLTSVELRIAELKSNLLALAEKRKNR